MSNFSNSKTKSSLCPTNGLDAVGNGAYTLLPDVLAVCTSQGSDNLYYYSTTFSGGPGVSSFGGFDTPNVKSPPVPGGSWGCVTGSPASSVSLLSQSNSPYSKSRPISLPHRPSLPITPSSTPSDTSGSSSSSSNSSPYQSAVQVSAPHRNVANRKIVSIATPPRTPDSRKRIPGTAGGESPAADAQHSSAALDFLAFLFPHSGTTALPYAKRVSLTSPQSSAKWEGVVLSLPGTNKILYVDGRVAENVSLRESIVALMDLADEHFGCQGLVIALEKSSPFLGGVLHSLMYVGGTVVTRPPFSVNPALVLVGMDI